MHGAGKPLGGSASLNACWPRRACVVKYRQRCNWWQSSGGANSPTVVQEVCAVLRWGGAAPRGGTHLAGWVRLGMVLLASCASVAPGACMKAVARLWAAHSAGSGGPTLNSTAAGWASLPAGVQQQVRKAAQAPAPSARLQLCLAAPDPQAVPSTPLGSLSPLVPHPTLRAQPDERRAAAARMPCKEPRLEFFWHYPTKPVISASGTLADA